MRIGRRIDENLIASTRVNALKALNEHTRYTGTWSLWHARRETLAQARQPDEIINATEAVAAAYLELNRALDRLAGLCTKHLN